MSLSPEIMNGFAHVENGEYFFKYERSTYVDARNPIRERLQSVDFTPHVIRRQHSVKYKHYDVLFYEHIEGTDLLHLPDECREQSYTNDFAKQLAQVFIKLDQAGFTDNDAHAGNFMMQEGTNKLYIVDDEMIIPKSTTPPKIIDGYLAYQFAYTLLGTYLGESIGDLIIELNRTGRLHTHQFLLDSTVTNQDSSQNKKTRQQEEIEALMEILKERDIADKIDPNILAFISEAFVMTTVPENFDRIFALG